MIKLINLLKETLTEISVEQLKTQFVDSGKISQEDFNDIINITPKTAYITWLAKKVADELIEVEDIYKYKKYFNIFDRRKREYPFTDINQYKTQDDLSQFIDKSIDIANKESEDVSQQKGVSKTDKYKEFYLGSVNGFNVYEIPKGRKDLYGTSCELGSGTEWCTATGNTRQHFDRYNADGPLFIFINPSTKEKYQFNYENEQFMDKNDLNIIKNKSKKYTNTFDLFKFIESKYPKYKTPFIVKLLSLSNLTDEDLIVQGNLDLTNIKIKSLPNGLVIQGNLDLVNSDIYDLPKDLKVEGYVDITYTPLADKYLEKYKSNIFGPQKSKVKKALKKDYPNLKVFISNLIY